ncbi:nucleoside deaminase [Roseimicrobium sp. ORNL1]|uniref:nucleoside deaminase n=1 Tax=Roseimicrobium sp. ORNL1 TaxID=2711231 RepID=UPI0013E19C38|nr:nucleoside deaminase [Roseimicrobium sp. ORNL1]QIF00217.1 nucleoside deaminase [Roseimicrobium sp. ORNL1]
MSPSADPDIPFLREAIRLSREHMVKGDGGPFGSVVVQEGQVVGEGWNQVLSTNDPTAHAEIVAIRDAGQRLGRFTLEGCVLYASCEPCPMCLAAAYWARVDRLVFAASREDAAASGFDDEYLYLEIPKKHTERALPARQLLQNEAREAFTEWLAKTDRVSY